MLKKKGFTLVELLTVIVILGLILGLATRQVFKSIQNSKNQAYSTLVTSIVTAGELYMADNASKYNDIDTPGAIIYVPIKELVDNSYLDTPLKNPKSNTDIPLASNIRIDVLDNKNIKVTFLLETNGPAVTFSPDGNVCSKVGSSTVTVDDDNGVDKNELWYQWTTSSEPPLTDSFTKSFINGRSLTTASDLNGTYYLWILASNVLGNTTLKSSEAFHLNNIPPTININGDTTINIIVGSTYNDQGATAVNSNDVDISNKIESIGTVNPNLAGHYKITYTVIDCENTTTATRTINVIDTAGPIITFSPNGNSGYTNYSTVTVTASDPGGVKPDSLKYQWTTNSDAPTEASFSSFFLNGSTMITPANVSGSYYLWILSKDISGNTTIMGSNPFYLDNTTPILSNINFNGYTPGTCTTGDITIAFTASDIPSGIKSYQYSDGAWHDISSTWIINNDYNSSIKFRILDNANNSSVETTLYNMIRKAIPPPKPGLPDLAASSDTGYSNTDNITKNTSVTISGSLAEANDILYIYNNGTQIDSTTVAANGTWSKVVTLSVTNGQNSITVRSKDICQTYSAYSDPLNIIVDTTNPTISLAKSPATWTTGNITITSTCSDTNLYVCPVQEQTQVDGVHSKTAEDRAGNVAGASVTIEHKTQYRYVDKYVDFDGSDYFKSNTAGIYGLGLSSGTTPFQFEAGVILDSVSTNFYLFDSAESGGDPRVALWYRASSGKIAFYCKYNGTVYDDYEFNYTPVVGGYHVFLLTGGTDASRTYTLYVDGVSKGSAPSCYRFATTAQNTYVGSRYTAADNLNGRIYYYRFQARKANTADVNYSYWGTEATTSWYAHENSSTAYMFNTTGATVLTTDSGWTDTQYGTWSNESYFRTRSTQDLYQ